MKIRQIKEAVDWEKSMDGNDNNLDRIKKLKNLQVDIPPVMGDALEDDENFDKNSKEVFTKLAKDAKSTTPENPGTGKKVTRKPYTEKLVLDESLFNDDDECMNEDYYHFEYKSGANPYIAKTEKERDRILRKYKNKVTKKNDKFFVIDDTEKDSFAIEEDYDRPIATMGLTNTSGIGIYDLNDEEVTYAFIDGGDKEPVKQTATVEYDCEDEEDCRPYFSVGDTKYFLDDFMRITESKSSNLKKKSLDEAKDSDEIEEEETVLDFVDSRLFGTNKRGSKPSSSNYRKVYNFLDDVQIPIKGGKGFSGAFFYPDSNSSYYVDSEGSGTTGKLGRRYPMFDDGIGVYLVDKDEEVLAKAVANELNFNYKLTPISSNKGFNYVAKIFIPESIMEMPIEEYLDSIGKSLKSYKKGTGKRGRKARNQE
jgi:hypothetical protein